MMKEHGGMSYSQVMLNLGRALEAAGATFADAAFMARRMQMTPLRRPGQPHEVAGPALLLATPAGAFITGQTLVVDGGTLITDGS